MTVRKLPPKSAYVAEVPPGELEEARRLAEGHIATEDLEAYVAALSKARSKGQAVPEVIAEILPPPQKKSPFSLSKKEPVDPTPLQQRLVQAGLTLSQIFKDGVLDIGELLDAHALLPTLSALEETFAETEHLLKRDVAERLRTRLFDPIQTLKEATAEAVAALHDKADRDQGLRDRLNSQVPPELEEVRIEDLRGHSIRGPDRYAIGDRVRVRRTSKPPEGGKQGPSAPTFEMGEVVGKRSDQSLSVAVRMQAGVGLKKIRPHLLEAYNPLKLADWIPEYPGSLSPGGPRGYNLGVVGLTDSGDLLVKAQKHGEEGWAELTAGQIAHVARSLADELGLASPGSVVSRQTPTQMLEGKQVISRAGNVNMVEVEGFDGRTVSGAAFTDQGIAYKSYNEDGVAVGRFKAGTNDRSEVYFAIVADQAGGHGEIVDDQGRPVHGALAQIAAERAERAAELVWIGTGTPDLGAPFDQDKRLPLGVEIGIRDVKSALFRACRDTHERIRKLRSERGNFNAAVAVCASIIKDEETADGKVIGKHYGVSVGDAMILHFSRDGCLKNATTPDNVEQAFVANGGDSNAALNYANVVTRMLGLDEEPELSDKDYYEWTLEPGDFIVNATDGLLDANLKAQMKALLADEKWSRNHADVTMEQIGAILAESNNAQNATQRLWDYSTAQMIPDDPEELASATAAMRAARTAGDNAAYDEAKDRQTLAFGSGKPDNRGFTVLQYRGS